MHKKITAHQAKKLLARKTGSGGFTLVELIVVIVIMGILTAAILPMVTGYVASAKEKVAESNQHMVEQATRLYLTDWEMENGSVSSTTITASELVEKGYLSALPEGEDYTVTITKNNAHYDVAVEKTAAGAEETTG